MKKLKSNIEERIRKAFRNELKESKKFMFCGPLISYVQGCSTFKFEVRNKETLFPLICEIDFSQFHGLVGVKNNIYHHKQLMEIIKIIHNNLCNEDNWEEVE